MKTYEKTTEQNQEILEIWKAKNSEDYFVIVKRKSDISWGAFYDLNKGYWEYGHYGYENISSARLDMLNMYQIYELDLYKKY